MSDYLELLGFIRSYSRNILLNNKKISSNDVTEQNIKNISLIDFSNSNLNYIPESIRLLVSIKTINLNSTSIKQNIDTIQNIAYLPSLEKLQISRNNLDNFPDPIFKLANLKELTISRNNIVVLPDHFTKLKNIEILNIRNNKISSLPLSLSHLALLRELDVSENEITVLNDEIGRLEKLEKFYISGNKLTIVSKNIGKLQKLYSLALSGNNLTILPQEFKNLNIKDEGFWIYDNPLTDPPLEIAMQGFTKIKEYFKSKDMIKSKNNKKNRNKFEFDVAFSFAGEDRIYVEEIADILKSKNIKIFYDKYEQANLWGKNLYTHLSNVYKEQARFCIVFASRHYKEKLWCNHELESAQARAFKESKEYILPARFDDTEIPGIQEITGFLDLRKITQENFVKLILAKLGV